MDNLLRNFDRVSFWLGFLAASLLWFLFSRLRPALLRLWENFRAQAAARRQERSLSDEIRLGNDTLRYAQRWHLASLLFSLDEVLVPPRLLAPPVPPMAYDPLPSEDITDWAIPNLPDWPELASFYGAPWLTPLEALHGSGHLVIIGQPGSGKTSALAALACQLIRKDPAAADLQHTVPLLVHAADLLPCPNPQDPLCSLLSALAFYGSSIPEKRRPAALKNIIERGHALLMLDGLDELDPQALQDAVTYLEALLKQYPALRVVAAADPRAQGSLARLDFVALPLAAWGSAQRALLISRWSDLWNRYLAGGGKPAVDPLLVIGWLLNNSEHLTPLELTLKVWAAFAGDSLGGGPLAALEAYLRRMLAGQPAKNRKALEQMAAQIVLKQQAVTERRTAHTWLGGAADLPAEAGGAAADPARAKGKGAPEEARAERVRASGALPDLVERGIIQPHAGDQVTIVHPALTGYLAAQALAASGGGAAVAAQPAWSGKWLTLGYLSILDSQAAWLEQVLQDEESDPLQVGLIEAGRWLRAAPEGLPWIAGLMRRLVGCLQQDGAPLALKARALSALVLSGNSGVATLLRQAAGLPRVDLRQLAALGLGMLRDVKSLNELIRLLEDPNPGVSRAAILGLVGIGDKHGMEAVATLLLNGDDSQRRAAAEGLANHPEEGYPTLEEGSGVEDAAIR
ncbi:MAG: HEAT repeat domain-containing protein, partial [Chloroflexota bacterium]